MFGRVFTRIEQLLSNVVKIGNEIRNCGFWRHCSILESNSIRDDTIPEDDSHITTISTRDFPRCCQVGDVLYVDVVAVLVGRLFENFLIGDHPFDADVRYWLNHGWRNCFLTRPHSSWTETKFVLEQIHSCDEMVLHVLWPCFFVDANTVFHGPAFHHEQRHDRMVVRCGRKFDLSVCSKFTVHRQDVAHVGMLGIENVVQIAQFVIPTLHEQINETLVAMTRVVRPEDVIWRELVKIPKDLEVEKILRRKEVIVHDGCWFEIVECVVVEFLVACTGRMKPAEFRIILGDVVDPATVPERLKLHGVEF